MLALIGGAGSSSAQVVINEIMYHPASENVLEEYIELHNRATTNVNVSGWRFSNGVDFTFPPNTIIPANGYLVVAAHRPTFITKYPGVANVIGNWVGVLSNSRNDIDLDDASGNRINSVEYADEGDWGAVRVRGLLDRNHRGWEWYKEPDGLGKSLELVNPALANEHGQNWLPSIPMEGTPGVVNSVISANIAPMILQVRHFPVVPSSTDSVTITARLLNETISGVTATLNWRVSGATPPPFTTGPMFDDGAHGDGAPSDGLFGATIPAHGDDTVIEFYISASDGQNNTRSWPAPALDEFGAPGQFCNALYQVDNDPQNAFGGVASYQPVYKIIMTELERAELAQIPGDSNNQGPNAQMNATFVSLDASGVSLHYLVGVRNRGHASRRANPPNYRVNFRSDEMWQDVTGINLNSQNVHIQHFGSLLAIRSGSAGSYSRAVQVRVNNANRANSGSPMFGSYAANEVYDSQWAERHFPNDSGGNVYKQVRDLGPPEFDYRTVAAYPSGFYPAPPSPAPNNFVNFGPEDSRTYTNTYYKETNVSEDDWTDLIGMLRVMGINGTTEFTEPSVRTVIDVDEWLTHLAVMCLLGNQESGLNDGHNDDYYMYAGAIDRRFILMHHDLDQILGFQSRPPTDGLFGMMNSPPRGSQDIGGVGRMMQRFLGTNYVFRTEYLQTLQRLIDTTFSKPQFDAFLDQTLGTYVPIDTINIMKSYMDQRRAHVQGLIQGNPAPGVATITGEPRSPTPSRNALMTVGGNDIVSYRFRLNNGSWGGERSITQALAISNLPQGSSNTVYVIGKTSAGGWQSLANPTVSRSWIVNTNWPAVRINEVLARNDSAINHAGTFPDYVELHNEGSATIDISGMRLTDDPSNPDKFTFPASTTLAPGAYLPLYANNNDGSGGIHLGFGLNDTGDDLYLFHRVADGGALLDSVRFGMQLPNLSIGRTNAGSTGSWMLCQPTASAANNPAALGNVYALRINEILASPQSPFADDFIEILNPNSAPVSIGGLSLTDSPIGAPNRHRIAELSFVAGNSYFVFTADGNANEFEDVNFQLSSDLGEVALIGPGNQRIDHIIYGPQRLGISYGRCPDGGSTFNFLVLPTPGSPNACPPAPPQPLLVMGPGHVWRFEDSGTDLGTTWSATNYNDSAWPSGPGFHGIEDPVTPYPINTVLTFRNPRQITYYFRTTFTVSNLVSLSALQLEYVIDDGAVFYLNGEELHRYNLPEGPIAYTNLAIINILNATGYEVPVDIPLSRIRPGENQLAVEVHQQFQGSADIVFGMRIIGVEHVDPGAAGIRINEVLANNGTIAEPDGSTPDWVEFYNPSDSPVNLAGMSVSDSTLNPDRFVFPAGTVVPARGYRTIRFDADRLPSSTNTGFGLNASGDSLYLFAPNNTVFDFVTFGFQAADFSIIRTGPTSWGLGVPTDGATNIPAILGDVTQLRINEWMANPVSGEDDWFEVYNPNNQPVSVGGCYLTDDLGNRTRYLPIPALSFIGAITNAWQEFVADGNIQNGAHHVEFNLRAAGEALGLSTTNGQPIDSITFSNQTSGVSQGRLLDGSANIVFFPGTPSPGDANYVLMNGVVINEVLTHTDLPLEDAVEIRNVGASAVNVSGWWLSDARGTPRKYQIPTTAPIPAGGYRVFYEYQFNNRDEGPIPFSFSSANGDEVFLSAVTNNILTGSRAQAAFAASANGVSFGRYVNSIGAVDYPAMSALSLGTSITRDSPTNQITTFRTGQGAPNPYPLVGPLVISEIMYHPPAIDTNDNVVQEFVEIHNPTASTVPLYDPLAPTNCWRLRDGVDFDFPPAMSLAPGGYLLVVSFNPANNPSALSTFRSRYGSNSVLVGPYSGKLDNGGEGVKLQKPDAPQTNGSVPFVLVDYVAYSDRAPWPTNADSFGASLQRRHAMGYGNDPTNWLAAAPSPGPSGVVDSDSDGMPNSWEQLYGFNPNSSSDASQDADGDGMTNLQEYLAGTHPLSAGSALRILSVLHAGNSATMQFNATSNRTYSVQFRDSLSTIWSPLTSVSASPTNGTRSVTDNNAGISTHRFYRVMTP